MKKIPLNSLVVMVGPSGAGKSTIVDTYFDSYEVVSSDKIRHELVGDMMRQDINDSVFREVHYRTAVKLDLGERVVVDATNLQRKDRMSVAEIGLRRGIPVFYLVVNRPLEEKLETQDWRAQVANLVQRHDDTFRSNEWEIMRGDGIANVIDYRMPVAHPFEAIKKLPKTGVLEEIKNRGFAGVTVIADIHGMVENLKNAVEWANNRNHFLAFLGDVIDYGPDNIECVNIVYDLVARGRALITMGNHERKIERWIDQQRKLLADPNALKSKSPIRLSDGNKATTDQIEALPAEARRKFENKFKALVSFSRHHWTLGSNLLLTHGAADPEMFKLATTRLYGRYETLALYGEVDPTNQWAEGGYPNRIYNWVDNIPEGKTVIVGHDIRSYTVPLKATGALGGTAYFIDTGSGKGGHLTVADFNFRDLELDFQNFVSF